MKLKNMIGAAGVEKKSRKAHSLSTVWGDELEEAHVLEEYPRPQLRRAQYQILNGRWQYAFTAAEAKRPEAWDGTILVPFSPESALSGVERQLQPNEALWYERTFTALTEGRLLLHFGAVDQCCRVYINDIPVGSHSGGYLSFSLDITEAVRPGENRLTVQVWDLSDTSWHSRGKQRLQSGGIFYTAQSGIWQTVWMETVPTRYIGELRITPLYDESAVRLEPLMAGDEAGEAETFEVTVRAADEILYHGEVRGSSFVLPLSKRIAWTPEHPFLYDLTVTCGADRVESYFAMRTFSREKDDSGIWRLCLNHQPYFMNGVLDQGYWPDGLMTAPSDAALIYDIQTMKSLGFTMLRKHCKIEPLRWYYHCDRLGMIVWQDIPNGGTDYAMGILCYAPTVFSRLKLRDRHYRLFSRQDPEGREEWRQECRAVLRQLYNCPCIAAWVIFNEGWGQFDANEGTELVRDLDAGRLIDQASGWFDQGGGDMRSVHNYFRRLRVEKKTRERAFVISEYGGYACYVRGHSFSEETFGYRHYSDTEALAEDFAKLQREIAALVEQGLAAAVYTQVSDVEEEVNGLLTYDRRLQKITSGGGEK